ncbi:MAG: glycosyltransferase family 9 protein, partial [Parachlamydiales bacterium]
ESKASLPKLLPEKFFQEGYVVLHPGSGSGLKAWEEKKWLELAQKLSRKGCLLVLTGQGPKELLFLQKLETAAEVAKEPGAVNLGGRLNLNQLQAIVQGARAVVCVDSMIAHLAGACGVKSFIFFNGLNNYRHWTPPESACPVFKKLPCFPCYRRRGCLEMGCLSRIETADFWQKLEAVCKKQRACF